MSEVSSMSTPLYSGTTESLSNTIILSKATIILSITVRACSDKSSGKLGGMGDKMGQ